MRITRTMNAVSAAVRGERWIDLTGASVLTAGLSALVFEFRGYRESLWVIAILALIQVSLVALLSRRWWLAPLLLAGGSLIGLVSIWQANSETEFILNWNQTYSWFRAFFLFSEPAPGLDLTLTFGLILPVAIMMFAAVHFISSLWFYLLWPAVFLVPVLIWHPEAITAYLIVLAGFFIQVPRIFTREIRRQRPQDATLPRAPMQWLAVPVVIVSILLANGLVPAQTMDWRLAPLANWVQDWQDLWQNSFGTGRGWIPFNLTGFGYSNTNTQLGGPVSLSTDLVLKVKAARPVLLKGSTRTDYTGHSWQKAALPFYRFDSPLWRSQRRHTFASALPSGAAGKQFARTWQREDTLEITNVQQLTSLFSAGNVQRIHVPDQLKYAPYFCADSNLFTFAWQPSMFSYTVEISLLDRWQPGFDQAVLAVEQDLASGSGAAKAFAQVFANDLQLPDDLPDIVRETALSVTAQAASPYAKALALEQYLREQGSYTLRPEPPPSDVDFVAHFLATRKGHCVYYATSLAIMARTLGIPARYVEGFGLDAGEKPGEYKATGKNAHAWAELYFQGLGWLAFDATPAGATYEADFPAEPEATQPPPQPTGLDNPEKAADSVSPAAVRYLVTSLVLILVLILAMRLFYSLTLRRHRQTLDPDLVRQRFPDQGQCLEYFYQDLLRQLACLKVAPEAGESLQQFAKRADDHVRIEECPLPEALWPVARLRYGDHQPDEDDLARLAALRIALESRLRADLRPLNYFFRRVLP